MTGRILTFLLLFGIAPLWGAPPRESIALQEIKITLEQLTSGVHSQKVESELILERLTLLEKNISSIKTPSNAPLELRIAHLEKAQQSLISDLQSLKGGMDATSSALAQCQKQLGEIDNQLNSDLKSLKKSLSSMLVLLKAGGQETIYTVKPGDSLGQIALEYKTDIKTLKELNALSRDTIVVGQKLKIP
ncbi:MAG: LysM peptidoglycan-binding domain-containing protein [Chlamydiales bacterium]